MDKLAAACEQASKEFDLARRTVDKPAVLRTGKALTAAWAAYEKAHKGVK